MLNILNISPFRAFVSFLNILFLDKIFDISKLNTFSKYSLFWNKKKEYFHKCIGIIIQFLNKKRKIYE
ncbi:hypothetical protein B0175_04975 [Arcobacter lacus]|uniref:Uncharacterized protein n=1 Tax=Arcobacter lacus TaxID=1912876 RepID=A0ABX5JHK9_9BACT|nr:hypothetical protein B0175_04975 [Arcobacter lacus]